MPSLLERVGRSLTRKKPEIVTSNRDSAGTALEGFEHISPRDTKGYIPPEPKSPTTEKVQNAFQSFLRSKSPTRREHQPVLRVPQLSLHLPDLSEGGTSITEKLGLGFEHPPDPSYSDEVLAARRLTTAETLKLIQKISSALIQRGTISYSARTNKLANIYDSL
jgi:hypothetical protein